MNDKSDESMLHVKKAFHFAWIEKKEDEAINELNIALRLDPNCSSAHLQLGQIFFHSSEHDCADALREFQEVVRISENSSEAHFWCGVVFDKIGKFKEAVKEFRKAIEMNEKDSRFHISLGHCLLKGSRVKEAIEALKKGIRLKPAYGEMAARMLLSDAYKADGKIELARKEMEIIAAKEPVWDYEKKSHARILKKLKGSKRK